MNRKEKFTKIKNQVKDLLPMIIIGLIGAFIVYEAIIGG